MTKRLRDFPASTIGRWFLEGPKALGALVCGAHTVLALLIFIVVHISRRDAQAGLAWVLLMGLDFPVSDVAWEYIAPTEPMEAIVEWGNNWGDGDNLRALILLGVLGGAQWFAVGWLAGNLFWRETGWIARWFDKK